METKFTPVLLAAFLAAPTFTQAPLLSISKAAFAAPVPSAGLSLPKNAAAWPEIAPQFQGLLSALAKEKEVGLNAPGEPGAAEVFAWRGANYKVGRASFVQMALNGALSKADYTVRSIDSNLLHDVNPFTHFEEGVSPFRPDIWKLPIYFVATDAKRNRALVGALLESDNALTLGLLAVPLEAAAPVAALPSIPAGAVLVKNGNNAMQGLTPPRISFSPLTRKPRTARGQVKDGAGRPIAGATVHAQSSAFGGIRTLHRAKTNAQGRYEIPLPTGVCQVTAAFATVSYGGKNYGLPLHPADGNLEQFEASRGVVENFSLRIWGAAGPQTANDAGNATLYAGASLRLLWMSEIASGGTFEITLSPRGPLLDGSTGKTLVYRFPNKNHEAALNNIPLGRYTLRARLLDGGDAVPVRLEPYGPSTPPQEALAIDFEPVSATSPDFDYSPTRQFSVLLRP